MIAMVVEILERMKRTWNKRWWILVGVVVVGGALSVAIGIEAARVSALLELKAVGVQRPLPSALIETVLPALNVTSFTQSGKNVEMQVSITNTHPFEPLELNARDLLRVDGKTGATIVTLDDRKLQWLTAKQNLKPSESISVKLKFSRVAPLAQVWVSYERRSEGIRAMTTATPLRVSCTNC